jgi:uncharacterized protein (DUF1330 family)
MTEHMPDAETLSRLRESSNDGSIVLLNLVKYRAPDGRAAFARYGAITGPLIAAAGGRVIFGGKAGAVLTGSDTAWDDVLLVRFPSVKDFLGMIESETYTGQAAPIRAEALEATIWMAVDPFQPFVGD